MFMCFFFMYMAFPVSLNGQGSPDTGLMTLPSVGITIRREWPDRGPEESSSCKDFYLGSILSKLRHFAGDDIILLVGNGIQTVHCSHASTDTARHVDIDALSGQQSECRTVHGKSSSHHL